MGLQFLWRNWDAACKQFFSLLKVNYNILKCFHHFQLVDFFKSYIFASNFPNCSIYFAEIQKNYWILLEKKWKESIQLRSDFLPEIVRDAGTSCVADQILVGLYNTYVWGVGAVIMP